MATIMTDRQILQHARENLAVARRDGRRRSITSWRREITILMAVDRANAGDATAARRLAWRDHVHWLRQEARSLGLRAHEQKLVIARIERARQGAFCAACTADLARKRQRHGETLAECVDAARSVLTYREWCRRERTGEDEPTVSPEQTLAEAGIDGTRQARYQRRMSSLLAGERDGGEDGGSS